MTVGAESPGGGIPADSVTARCTADDPEEYETASVGVAVIPMTAGAGVRVAESVCRGGYPIIIGARLVETADGVEEAAWGMLWESIGIVITGDTIGTYEG